MSAMLSEPCSGVPTQLERDFAGVLLPSCLDLPDALLRPCSQSIIGKGSQIYYCACLWESEVDYHSGKKLWTQYGKDLRDDRCYSLRFGSAEPQRCIIVSPAPTEGGAVLDDLLANFEQEEFEAEDTFLPDADVSECETDYRLVLHVSQAIWTLCE